jgi:hypothetical protein
MSTRTALVAIALLLLAIAIVSPHGSSSKGPYRADLVRSPGVLNPDVTQANVNSTICVQGWTRTIRPPTSYTNALKRKQMREYGVGGSPSDYQEDHLISLELGGHPTIRAISGPSRTRARPTSTRSRTTSTGRSARAICHSNRLS